MIFAISLGPLKGSNNCVRRKIMKLILFVFEELSLVREVDNVVECLAYPCRRKTNLILIGSLQELVVHH